MEDDETPSLTPEERQRIYLEEKARLEIRQELQHETKTAIGKVVGIILLCGLGILVLVVVLAGVGANLNHEPMTAKSSAIQLQERATTCEEAAMRKAIEEGVLDQSGKVGLMLYAATHCAAIIEEAHAAKVREQSPPTETEPNAEKGSDTSVPATNANDEDWKEWSSNPKEYAKHHAK